MKRPKTQHQRLSEMVAKYRLWLIKQVAKNEKYLDAEELTAPWRKIKL